MKYLLVLFCLFASFTTKAESFNYMYSGSVDEPLSEYTRINEDPVILTFIEELQAIQLIYEGNSLMFTILSTEEGRTGIIVKTVANDGRRAKFIIAEKMTAFELGKYIYVITNLPKYKL